MSKLSTKHPETLGPCGCQLCRRYGNTSGSSNTRPLICHVADDVWARRPSQLQLLLHIHGRCARCHHPLGNAAYMVKETVYAGAIAADLGGYQRSFVPVCPECATFEELDNQYRQRVVCGGCGRQLRVPAGRYRWFCDDACRRVAGRRDRRYKQLICKGCNTSFTSARVDAEFCSGACRQRAYRQRRAA
jgi:hypothetical protein